MLSQQMEFFVIINFYEQDGEGFLPRAESYSRAEMMKVLPQLFWESSKEALTTNPSSSG